MTRPPADPGTDPGADPGTAVGTGRADGLRPNRLLAGGAVLVIAIVGWAGLVWWAAAPGSGRLAFGRPGLIAIAALLLAEAAVVLGAALLPIGRPARTIVAIGAVVLVTLLGVAGHDAAQDRRLDPIIDDLTTAARQEQQVPQVGTAPCRAPSDATVYQRLGLSVDQVCVFGGRVPEVHLLQTGPDTDLGPAVPHGLIFAPTGVIVSKDVCVRQLRDQWWERSGLLENGADCPAGFEFRGA